MAANRKPDTKTNAKPMKKLSRIKERTLKDLDFYIFHGCGD